MEYLKIFYDKLFVGTYFYFIKIENKGSFSLDYYFALTSVITLVFSHSLFLGGSVVLLNMPALLMNIGVNLVIILIIFFLGWLLFLRRRSYERVVQHYKKDKSILIKRAIIVNGLMIGTLFLSAVVAVLRIELS